jgi:C4-dicarboxylate-specific signal transduction histidine kinase
MGITAASLSKFGVILSGTLAATTVNIGSQSANEGNTLQIEKILMNLLRNAVEACQSDCKPEKSGRIVIEGVEAGECVCLRVDDNGPGVPTDLIPRLFLPFVSSKPGGIGMGLPISQALARSLGGVLSYEAAPGGGARFLLTLPLSAETCSGLSL